MRACLPIGLAALVLGLGTARPSPCNADPGGAAPGSFTPRTRVSLRAARWCINDELTNRGTRTEGLLMNVPHGERGLRGPPQTGPGPGGHHGPVPGACARLCRARRQCLHARPPGRDAGLRGGAELGVRAGRLPARAVPGPRGACHRGVRPGRAGGHPRLLLPAAGPGPGRRGRRACRGGQRGGVDQGPRLPQRRARGRQRVRPRRLRPPPDPHRGGRGRADPAGEEDGPRTARLHERPGPRALPRRPGRGGRLPPDPLQRHAARGHPGPDRGAQAIREADRLQRGPEVRRGRRTGCGAVRGERRLLGLHGRGDQPASSRSRSTARRTTPSSTRS